MLTKYKVYMAEKSGLNTDLSGLLAEKAAITDRVISELLAMQTDIPARLRAAMDYMLTAGGKRIRAAVVLLCCELVSGTVNRNAEVAAAAVEMVHTYSLVHDDLPAMDDDDFRRGCASCHRAFDEATAILTGDALLTLAFEILACHINDTVLAVRMIKTLSQACGPAGMIAGQMADMCSAGAEATLSTLRQMHINKTARMFACAAAMGAIAGDADDNCLENLLKYGLKLGLCFQIADDILDVSQTSDQLGKTAGKDAAQGKLTYPSLAGLAGSKNVAIALTDQAIAALNSFGPEADALRKLAKWLLERTQ